MPLRYAYRALLRRHVVLGTPSKVSQMIKQEEEAQKKLIPTEELGTPGFLEEQVLHSR
jgi:hypothetical protein